MPYHTESKSAPAKKSMGKMTDAQKTALNKHMEKHKGKMSTSEAKRHRMQMMSRMRKGMSVASAHKDIMKA